jgi:hypothetical protein
MNNKLSGRGKLLLLILASFLCGLSGINSCGIYTASGILNPPFGQQTRPDSLIFHGYNTESFFSGYIIWYKEAGADNYSICVYKGKLELPTIPKVEYMEAHPVKYGDWVEYNDLRSDPDNPRVEFTVYIQDLRPLGSSKNFVELNDSSGQKYYFGVSSYGTEGQESEMIEFGIWPAT